MMCFVFHNPRTIFAAPFLSSSYFLVDVASQKIEVHAYIHTHISTHIRKMPGGIAAHRGAIIEEIINTYSCPDYETYCDDSSVIVRGKTNDHREVKCHTLPKGTISLLAFGQVIMTTSVAGSNRGDERRMLRLVYKNRMYRLGIIDIPGGYIVTALRGNDVKVQVILKRKTDGKMKATVFGKTYTLVKKKDTVYRSLYVVPRREDEDDDDREVVEIDE